MQKVLTLSPVTLILYVGFSGISILNYLFTLIVPNAFLIIPRFISFFLALTFPIIITLIYLELKKFNYQKTLLTLLYSLYVISHIYFIGYEFFFLSLITLGGSIYNINDMFSLLNSLNIIHTVLILLNFLYLLTGFILIFSPLMPKLRLYGALYLGVSIFSFILSRILFLNVVNTTLNVFSFGFFLLALFTNSMTILILFFWYKGDYRYTL